LQLTASTINRSDVPRERRWASVDVRLHTESEMRKIPIDIASGYIREIEIRNGAIV